MLLQAAGLWGSPPPPRVVGPQGQGPVPTTLGSLQPGPGGWGWLADADAESTSRSAVLRPLCVFGIEAESLGLPPEEVGGSSGWAWKAMTRQDGLGAGRLLVA